MAYIIDTPSDNISDSNGSLAIKYPFNAKGVFRKAYTQLELAKASLTTLLLTTKGERIMLPEFGTNLASLLFEPITPELTEAIKTDIRESINSWISYLVVDDIKVTTLEDDPRLLHDIEIEVTTTISQTGNTVQIGIGAGNGTISIGSVSGS